MMARQRLVPLLVATPMFLQNLDTTALALALPSIARSLQVPTLHLNLAITAYLLSMAVFLPASGWLADRFGARRTFCTAIAVFSAGSVLCGLSTSLEMLVTCRLLQGLDWPEELCTLKDGKVMLRTAGEVLELVRNCSPPAYGTLVQVGQGGHV